MDVLRVIPLGGAGEIGRNSTIVECGEDMILIDCGLSFPNEEMLGVDIVIPDFTYVLENKEKLRAIVLTHAHEDHVGALPYLLPKVNVPVYGTEFTLALVRAKLEERIDMSAVDLRVLKPGDPIEAGTFKVEPIRITHSIPETCCMAVRTPHGIVLFTADFKFDFTPVDNRLTDMARLAALGEEGVLLLLSDSTNVERTGWSPSERVVTHGLRKYFLESSGRVLLTTFASNIHRMQQVFDVAEETGRRVAVAGRRMEQTIDICGRMGYLKIPVGVKIPLEEVHQMEPAKVVILTTGSQGEPLSALVQMSKEEYGRLRIQPGDTILYSARPIPGNEAAIWRTVNRLFRIGARVVYDGPTPIHVSGHGYQEELKMMINLTRPFYLAPVHGEPRHQHLYLEIARGMGYPDHRLFLIEDGHPLAMDAENAWLDEPVHTGRVLVDNGGHAGVSEEVLRDRYNLANDGVVSVTIAVDTEVGEVVGDPVITAKGYSGPERAIDRAVEAVWDAITAMKQQDLRDIDQVRHVVTDVVRRTVQRHSQLRPLVVTAIVEI